MGKTSYIQADWERRTTIDNYQLSIARVADYMNRFDNSARFRLASINEKLSRLERQMSYIEGALQTISDAGK